MTFHEIWQTEFAISDQQCGTIALLLAYVCTHCKDMRVKIVTNILISHYC